MNILKMSPRPIFLSVFVFALHLSSAGQCGRLKALIQDYWSFQERDLGTFNMVTLRQAVRIDNGRNFFTVLELQDYYQRQQNDAAYAEVLQQVGQLEATYFINPGRGRDMAGDVARQESLRGAINMYRSHMDTSFFTLSPYVNNKMVALPDHLEALCMEITADRNLTFKPDSIMFRLLDDKLNFSPPFVKWLFIIALNEVRSKSPGFTQFINDADKLDAYCNNRQMTPEDYNAYYDVVVKGFTGAMRHAYNIARQITANCDPLCLEQLKAQLADPGAQQAKALQLLLSLAAEKQHQTGLGFLAINDF